MTRFGVALAVVLPIVIALLLQTSEGRLHGAQPNQCRAPSWRILKNARLSWLRGKPCQQMGGCPAADV